MNLKYLKLKFLLFSKLLSVPAVLTGHGTNGFTGSGYRVCPFSSVHLHVVYPGHCCIIINIIQHWLSTVKNGKS